MFSLKNTIKGFVGLPQSPKNHFKSLLSPLNYNFSNQNKKLQSFSSLLMCRPAKFGYNAETEIDNHFQCFELDDPESISLKVIKEFEKYIQVLRSKGIPVWIYNDTPDPVKPNAVFCNTWQSTHDDGTVVLYPLRAKNRRTEVRRDVIQNLEKDLGFEVKRILDYTGEADKSLFLEGRGSMVFDHINKIIYSTQSTRTSFELVQKIASELGFEVIFFRSQDELYRSIYHADFVLSIGEKWAILCEESILNDTEREQVKQRLESTGHELILISLDQVYEFVANCYEVVNDKGEKFVVMSSRGAKSLNEKQIATLEKYAKLLPVNIKTIEKYGGGGARAMISELRLNKVKK